MTVTTGKKIADCRKKTGMTQEDLAEKLKISRQAVSRWETGEAMPDTEKIIQLSRLFQVSTDYLLLDEKMEIEEKTATPESSKTEKNAEDKRTRRALRIYMGKFLLIIGTVMLGATLIGVAIFANFITSWYTALGRYGTVLFRGWGFLPFLLGIFLLAGGWIVLINEYRKTKRSCDAS